MRLNFGEIAFDFIATPFKRLHERRKAKRAARNAEKAAAGGEFLSDEETDMSETMQSFLRGLLKFAAGAAVAKGLIDVGDAATLQVAIETFVGGAIGLVGFFLSHRKHAA